MICATHKFTPLSTGIEIEIESHTEINRNKHIGAMLTQHRCMGITMIFLSHHLLVELNRKRSMECTCLSILNQTHPYTHLFFSLSLTHTPRTHIK